MKMYHGSKVGDLKTIKSMQAVARTGVSVPDDELKNGIYVTPNYGYALAMAARPRGVTKIDDATKTIEFENYHLFNPDEIVFIYEIDVDDDGVKQIDENQFIIEGLNEIIPTDVHEHVSVDLEKYYELKKMNKEPAKERSSWMRFS